MAELTGMEKIAIKKYQESRMAKEQPPQPVQAQHAERPQPQKQAPRQTYEQGRQKRRELFGSFVKATGTKAPPRKMNIKQPVRGGMAGFFRGSQPRRTPQPQQNNPHFSNFLDFGKPHPLSGEIRIGAGSGNDKKYIRNRFLW